MFWAGLLLLTVLVCGVIVALWRRGYTIQELVRRPPEQVDLPEVVNILSYLHHELIKHRLPLVRTVADSPLEDVDDGDLHMLREAVTGTSGRPSLVGELEGYLGGLRRAAGGVYLNFWRDPLVRRARRACRDIQRVADGLAEGERPSASQHRKLQAADAALDDWFRPRLVALRSSVLSLEVTRELFEEPVARVIRELGVPKAHVELPALDDPLLVRMLLPDFNLVVRNLVRNGLQRSIEATGEPRVAIDVSTRMELTGDESVLISVHDSDETILSRENLYGGAIGRGLNIVTTTLRRYDAALRCVASQREGFAKRMEVRLFLAEPDTEGLGLLRRSGLGAWGVPVTAAGTTLAVCALCALGWAEIVPDPLIGLGIIDNAPPQPDPFRVQTARQKASLDVFLGVEAASNEATREAFSRRPDLARGRVPSPAAIQVDPGRCAPPQRIISERRLEVECHLLRPNLRLGKPVLSLRVDGDYDPGGLDHVVRELVIEGDTTRSLAPKDSCMVVTPLAAGADLPAVVAAHAGDRIPKKAAYPRIIVDYHKCLAIARYPLRVTIGLQRPKGSPRAPADDPTYQPTSVDIRVRLRRLEEAKDAYARIHNDGSVLAAKTQRWALSRTIAQRVARLLEGSWDPGTMPDALQKHLSKALYIGWVRSSLYTGMWARIDGEAAGKGPTPELCRLDGDTKVGFTRIGELDPKAVKDDLYRSQYYTMHSRLWIRGELVAAMREFDEFQDKAARQTDFVQGARVYLATLLALGKAPDPNDPETDPYGRLDRITRLLSDLKRHARRPPRRGKDYLYDRVKLMGIHKLLGDEGDEGFSVDDTLCAFRRARPGWTGAMDADDQQRIFGHCPTYVPPAPEPDPDAGGELPAPPKPKGKVTPSVQRVENYLLEFTSLMRGSTWKCETPP